MDIAYKWTYRQVKICRKFSLLIWILFISQLIHPVGYRMGEEVLLASCEHNFIRVHNNLLQHPSNNISIEILSI